MLFWDYEFMLFINAPVKLHAFIYPRIHLPREFLCTWRKVTRYEILCSYTNWHLILWISYHLLVLIVGIVSWSQEWWRMSYKFRSCGIMGHMFLLLLKIMILIFTRSYFYIFLYTLGVVWTCIHSFSAWWIYGTWRRRCKLGDISVHFLPIHEIQITKKNHRHCYIVLFISSHFQWRLPRKSNTHRGG